MSCSDSDSRASSDFEFSSEFKEMMRKKGGRPSDGDGKSTEDESEEHNQTFTTKNYCYVCGKGKAKLSRHFQKHAAEEPEIAEALALPKGSSERKGLLNVLRSRGNHEHNQKVLTTKRGSLKLLHRPKTKTVKTKKYVHCPYCKGMIVNVDTHSHVVMCVKRKSTVAAVRRAGRPGDVPPDSWEMEQKVPHDVTRILSSMKQDEITLVLQNDDALIQLALSLIEEHGSDPGKEDYIRRRLRDMGRLLFRLHEKSILKLEDAFQPKHFGKVLKVVKALADFNVKIQTYNKPGRALKIAESLKKIGHIFLNRSKSKEETKEDVSAFLELCEKEWLERPPPKSISQSSNQKVSSLSTIPFTQDVQRLHTYLENSSASAVESLTAHENAQAFISLSKLTLTQAMLLNPFSLNVSKLTLRSFQERDDSPQVLFNHFVTVNISGETGRSVPILLTSQLVSALTLLISKRVLYGVHKDNPLLFAKPDGSATGHYGGRGCIQDFSHLYHASKPEHLTSGQFHYHTARIFQILSLENDELEYLSMLLGHEIQTDRHYYRNPEAAVELAKIAKLLLAMEKGSLERVKGKSLEDIEIEDVLEPDKQPKNLGRGGAKEDTNKALFLLQKKEDVELKLRAEEDALEHIKSRRDKSFLQEKFIDSFKGKGLFTCESIEPSSFVVEYRGNIFARGEGKHDDTVENYIFNFSWNRTNWCVDASAEDGSLGRFVNDEQKNPSCELKTVVYEGKPHLCLFALKKISPGEEITFNYGNRFYPWRSEEEDSAESSSYEYSYGDEDSNFHESFSRSEASSESEGLPSLDDSDSVTQDLRCTTKNFCFVCGEPKGKMSRHLKTHIAQVPEIAEVFKLRRNSKERKRELAKLRNKGNQMHNKHVLKTRQGELKIRKKLSKSSLETFAVCIYCKDMFCRKTLWQHMQNCPSKVSNPPARGSSQILAGVAARLIDPKCISSDMKKFLEALKEDEVGREVLKDPYLLQLAQCIFSTFKGKWKDTHVRRRLRQMGRLLLILQEKCINRFEEALKPQNFPGLLEAVKKVTGSDKDPKYSQRATAEIANSLRKLADIKYAMSLNGDGDREAARESKEFMKLCLEEWPAKNAVQTIISSLSTIPFIQDVQVLYQFTQETVASAAETLTNFGSAPVYTALLRGIIAFISFLNGVEMAHVTLKSFQERREDENTTLCEFEQILAKRTVKINVANQKDKKIVIVLTPDLLSATELLVEKRGVCGVHENNPYLFAKPSASMLSTYSMATITKMFVSRCGARQTENLKSAFFRKYVKMVFQILVLGNEELGQLAKLLGRDIPTQREYYQTPEASADIARILELLSAVSTGSLEIFKGKSLGEIEIPDQLLPVTEKNSATKTGKSEDAAQERAKKRKSSSSKNPGKQKRKRSQNGDDQMEAQNTKTIESLKETAAEKVVDAPAHSKDTAICFSDDDKDMHVDFDMNFETDSSNDEDVGNGADEAMDDSDAGSEGPANHGGDVVKEVSEAQCGTEKDTSGDHNANEQYVNEKVPENAEADKYSTLSSSFSKGKKFPLMIKEVKILLPKLSVEELKALLHPPRPSGDPQLVEDQPDLHTRKQRDSTASPTEETPTCTEKLQMSCSNCKKTMMRGHTAYQKKGFEDVFCSKLCLFKRFSANGGASKKCHLCLKKISKPLDLVMAVVDLRGTTKEFCSTTCLCYFKTKHFRIRKSVHSKSTTISPQIPPSRCSLCNKTCSTSHEVDLDDAIHNFCSDACLEDFCRVNMGVCLSCGATCCKKPLRLKLIDATKVLCDTKCLEEFKERTDIYYQCHKCQNYLPMSDMLHHRNNDYNVELFCNWDCLSSYKEKCIEEQENSDLKNKEGKQSEQTSKADEEQLSSDSAVQEGSGSLSEEAPHPTVSLVDAICCICSKELITGSSKYQINTEVFCSVPCVKEKHPHIKYGFKVCQNCFNVIKRPQNLILAPVDDSGVMMELCSNKCLSAVKTKRKTAAVKPQPQQGPCSLCKMCAMYCYCKLQETIDNEVHGFCSQSCLVNYHKINKQTCSVCDVCSKVYLDKRLTVTTEGSRKNICGDVCLVKFKERILTLLTCPTCCTSHRMSDMIENKDCEAELKFFCSHRCLTVHKAQTITTSDTKSPSFDDEDVKEVKPLLPNLNSTGGVMTSIVSPKKQGHKIKEEKIDEDYNRGLPASMFLQNVKDEPDVKKEDLRISSVFSIKEESKPAQPVSKQTDLPSFCSACKTVLRDGETVYQRKGHGDIFCSTSCLLKFHQNKTVKTCHFCLQMISQPQAAVQVLVKNEATKDFCSQTCLSSFNYKSIMSTKISIAGLPSQSQCSVCCRYCISKHEVIHQEVVHKICSIPCLHRFCNINSLSVCENCQACSKTPLMLKMEDGHKALCSTECLSHFSQKIQTPQLCSLCGTSAVMSNMIPHKNREGLLELFCTNSCLMASKMQVLGSELNCNNCGAEPACHLTMSDASIRGFCTLACAISFKETHKDQSEAANAQETSIPMETNLSGSPNKPACAQCRQIIHTPPTVIHYKGGMNFVCSPVCAQEFKRINNISSLCEYCKNERLINEVKKVNNKDCCFCSEGCKILFHYELEKKWGKHCQSCTFCLSVSKTVLTVHDEELEKEFCSAECSFRYTSLRSHESACDMCSHTGRLKESLPLLGEVKHFCDLKCLLLYCSKEVQVVHTGSLASRSVGSGDSLPYITSIISLSNSVAPPAQPGALTDIQSKVVGHASIQTDPVELKNKSVFCVPVVHNKGTSCTVRTVEKQTQTVTIKQKVPPAKSVLPLPVPVYIPLPMSMYSQITPQPVALPVLLPVPVFLSEKPDSSEQKPTPAEAFKADISCSLEKEMNHRTEQEDHGKEENQRQQILSHVTSPVMLQTVGDGDGGPVSVDLVSFNDHPVADPDLQLAPSNTEKTVYEPLSETPPLDPGLGTSCCHPPDLPPQKPSSPSPSPLVNIHDKQEWAHNEETSQQRSSKATSQRPLCVKSKYGVLSWRKWIQRRKSKADVDHVSSSAVKLKADILGCSSSELNESLRLFVREMKQRNGEPYSPDRLFYLCLCIQKYLFENMRAENIFSDQTYHTFSLELTRILMQFRPSLTGRGVIRSYVEEQFLWDCKQLGVYSPMTLLNTLLFFFCKYFHFTTMEQHLQLSFAQLKTCIRSKEDGRETAVLRFQLPTSSNQEEPGADVVPAKKLRLNDGEDFLEIEENSAIPSQCPVRLFKFYISKCSESTTCRDDVFYLQPGQSCVPSSPLWFSSTPLDDATIEAMMVRILTIREMQRDKKQSTFPNAP
ncbi:uncharacterized protein LOC101157550 isoform X2 [Oryzias latipes]